MRQLPLDLARDPLPPFAAVLQGENAAVVAHLRDEAWPAPPVYLWGPAGAGKTLLLRETRARAVQAGLLAQWFDATTPSPWRLHDDVALVLLDTIDAWDAARQEAAFGLYVDAASRAGNVAARGLAAAEPAPARTPLGVQFIAAARVPPVDLAVREDLRTRLGWGPVHAVRPLDEADARAALRHETQRHGLPLGDDVLDYLLARFARDLRSLMTLVVRLEDYALSQRRPVTVALLRRMLDEEAA
ncbi:MAG TPA: DnaA/Hda family protein [Burkholderiaceae bacterium]|nr:DnaA/Hda family protein [Burkholderiaceae bacterium]